MWAFLLKVFKQPPYIEQIQDTERVKTLYEYWRIRILYSMFVGYGLYYFTRKSFTFAMPGLKETLGYENPDMGLLASIFSITYGISKFASGILSDRCNPRYFMAAGLMLTGIINIAFGFSSSLFVFSILWGLNGWFQGFGWPPCARFLTHWYSHSERGSWWSIWNISHNLGAFIIPWIVGGAMQYWGWRYAMYIPGIICFFGGFYLINRLRDTPQSLGLPSIEVYRNDFDALSDKNQEKELTAKQLLFDYVLKNKYIWALGIAYFFVYVVRMGINDWTALFLREEKGYSMIGANGSVSMFEVGGFFGCLVAGWSSDYLFKANRGPVNVLFSLGMLISLIAFWYVPKDYAWLDSTLIFLIGFTLFGPQMMIGIAAAELSHKKAAATATGFVGYIAYMGAAVAGYPLALVTQYWAWDGFFWFLVLCSILAIVFLLPLWSVQKKPMPSDSKAEYA